MQLPGVSADALGSFCVKGPFMYLLPAPHGSLTFSYRFDAAFCDFLLTKLLITKI